MKLWSIDDGMLLKTIRLVEHESVHGIKVTKKGLHILARPKSSENLDYGRLSVPEEADEDSHLEVLLPSALSVKSIRQVILFNSI